MLASLLLVCPAVATFVHHTGVEQAEVDRSIVRETGYEGSFKDCLVCMNSDGRCSFVNKQGMRVRGLDFPKCRPVKNPEQAAKNSNCPNLRCQQPMTKYSDLFPVSGGRRRLIRESNVPSNAE